MEDRSVQAARLADQIRDYLAQWLWLDFPNLSLTVHQTTLSPDLSQATVWISSQASSGWLNQIKRAIPKYQSRLYKTLDRRAIPKLTFKEDVSEEMDQKIDALLKGQQPR